MHRGPFGNRFGAQFIIKHNESKMFWSSEHSHLCLLVFDSARELLEVHYRNFYTISSMACWNNKLHE
jgi:hypothetical protein